MKLECPVKKRLKEARLKKGISQKSLGILIRIDEFNASARMNQYETGKQIPDYFTLKKIADVFNIPTAYFYAEDEKLADSLANYYKEENVILKN